MGCSYYSYSYSFQFFVHANEQNFEYLNSQQTKMEHLCYWCFFAANNMQLSKHVFFQLILS